MIKKLIRKLFGQDSAGDAAPSTPDEAAADTTGATGKTRRKSTHATAKPAPKAAPEPDVPIIISSDIHGIDPTLISRNAIRVTEGLQIGRAHV